MSTSLEEDKESLLVGGERCGTCMSSSFQCRCALSENGLAPVLVEPTLWEHPPVEPVEISDDSWRCCNAQVKLKPCMVT